MGPRPLAAAARRARRTRRRAAGLEAPADGSRALAHADQPTTTPARGGATPRRSVTLTDQHCPARSSSTRVGTSAGVPHHVGQGLLDDAVRREAGADPRTARHPAGRPATRRARRAGRPADPLDQSRQGSQPGSGPAPPRLSRSTPSIARSSASAVRPDSSMAASASPRPGGRPEAQPLGTGLHHDHRHRVGDHVVQLPGDAVALGLGALGGRRPRLHLQRRGAGGVVCSDVTRRLTNVPAAQAPAHSIHGQKSSASPSSVTSHASDEQNRGQRARHQRDAAPRPRRSGVDRDQRGKDRSCGGNSPVATRVTAR